MSNPLIDQARVWDDLMALAAITDPDRPYTRRSSRRASSRTRMASPPLRGGRPESPHGRAPISSAAWTASDKMLGSSCSAPIPTPCPRVGASMGRPALSPGLKWCARCRRRDTGPGTRSRSSTFWRKSRASMACRASAAAPWRVRSTASCSPSPVRAVKARRRRRAGRRRSEQACGRAPLGHCRSSSCISSRAPSCRTARSTSAW